MGKELEQADKSLFFLTVLLGSILLSWRALWLQRQGLCRGEETDVIGLRLAASVLVVLSLSVFFCLALQGRREAAGTDGRRPPPPTCWPPCWCCWPPCCGWGSC